MSRSAKALIGSVAALAQRGIGLAYSVVSLPLLISLVDNERFGVWLTLSSFLGWVSLLDAGIGNEIVGALARRIGEEDTVGARRVIGGAMSWVFGAGAVSLIVGLSIAPLVDWGSALGTSSLPHAELTELVVVGLVLSIASLPLALVDRLYTATQDSWVTAAVGTGGLFASFSMLYFAPTPVRVSYLAAAALAPSCLGRAASGIAFFFWWRPSLRPKLSEIQPSFGRPLLRNSIAFLGVQLVSIVMWSTDNIVIAQLHGAEAVTSYATAMRIASTFMGLTAAAAGPLWPAYADAFARRDTQWVRRRVWQVWAGSLALAVIGAVTIQFLGGPLISIWTRGRVAPPDALLLAGIGFFVLQTLPLVGISMALNGAGALRGQLVYGSVAAVLNIVLSVVLGLMWGPTGVCWATGFACLLISVCAPLELRAVIRAMEVAAPAPTRHAGH